VSLYITSRAMKDAKLISTDGITNAISWIQKRFKGKNPGQLA
jgi:hypothetical protein